MDGHQFCCVLCGDNAGGSLGVKDGFSIFACASCGLAQVLDMPDDAFLADYYKNYHGNQNKIKHKNRKLRLWILKLLPLFVYARFKSARGNKKYLDIGCSIGFSVEAARRLGWQAFGHDMSAEAILIAKNIYPKCDFRSQTLQEAGYSASSFDFIVASEVIEHLRQPREFVAQVSGLLRTGGYFYITTPDAARFPKAKDLLEWKEVCPPHHLLYFNQKNLCKLLAEHNLAPIMRFPVNKPNIRMLFRKI